MNIIKELIKGGADVNARDKNEGQTPLGLSSAKGACVLVQICHGFFSASLRNR